ncbi:7230_t:CDS:2 [Acaulospora morrowiae]|uniref:7230_t:CDS:1 n=1 Tax=Acaulospora morrowiae TaxID=94023 RepID=A0A9N9EYR4_9GLOM|nr:7230_t:CDS:2 [Acaulospora morrowiae]
MSSLLPPETLEQVFKDLSYVDLRSCVLVNRAWCASAVRYLWKNPFGFRYSRHKYDQYIPTAKKRVKMYKDSKISLAQTYIWCLNDKSKRIIMDVGVVLPNFMIENRPTFDYSSTLTTLNHLYLYDTVGWWLSANSSEQNDFAHYVIVKELYKMFIAQSVKIKFLSFGNIDSIQLQLRKNEIKSDILPILCYLPGAEQFFARIEKFSSDVDIPSEIWYELAQIATNIKDLEITDHNKHKEGLPSFIQAQNNLRKLKIVLKGHPKWSPLVHRAVKAKASSLTHLTIIDHHDFIRTYQFSLNWIAECTNLEEFKLCISNSFSPSSLDLGSLASFPFLTKLELVLSCLSNTHIKMIRKTDGQLKSLCLLWKTCEGEVSIVYDALFDAIKKTCGNLSEIELTIPEEKFLSTVSLLKALNRVEVIKFVQLCSYGQERILDEINISILLPTWGRLLPLNLRKLWFKANWVFTYDSFRAFLKSVELRLTNRPLNFLFGMKFPGNSHFDLYQFYVDKGILDNESFVENGLKWKKLKVI